MSVQLLNCDCMEYMKMVPDKHFDLAVVDPPYGISITKECIFVICQVYISFLPWDESPPSIEYFDQLFRISKNQIIWGGNYFNLPPSRYFCIWDKGESMYGRDFAEAEFAWVRSGGTRIKKIHPNQPDRIHPTQKPVKLYNFIFNNYAKPGQLVFDSHLGSGSSAISAHYFGLEFVGCELDGNYFRAAEKRFKSETRQMKLI